MEFTLHRQLKACYAEGGAMEVPVDGFRIDAVRDGELIEVQLASLAAIRAKAGRLLEAGHRVRIVKPIVHRRRIVRQKTAAGPVLSRRRSPKAGALLDLFDEFVHLARLFPHPHLVVEVPLVDIEQWRLPVASRRRNRPYRVRDEVLEQVLSVHRFRSPRQLLELVAGERLAMPFHTGDLAAAVGRSRWQAQRIAYCLRETGAVRTVGKRGNAWLYEAAGSGRRARAA